MLSNRRKKFNRMNVFATLMISYILVLLIPLSIGGGLYSQVEGIMIENANNANSALIEQVKQVVDGRLEEMGQLARHIYTHPQLPSLLRHPSPLAGKQSYDFIQFKDELERFSSISTFISDFYVYFHNSDTVLTPAMKTNSRLFYSNIYGYEQMSYEQWLETLQEGQFNRFLPSASIGQGISQRNVVTYIQSLPLGERTAPAGALVFLINEQEIQQLMAEIIKANNGALFIKDATGQVLLRTGDPGIELAEDAAKQKNTMTVSTLSLQSGWEYISVVPNDVFWDKVNIVKMKAFSMLILCLVAGGFVCSLMSYRAYRPVKEIIQSIGSRKPHEEKQYLDEYDYIKSSVIHSMEKHQELEGQLLKQTPVIRTNFLIRLLKGYVEWDQLTPETLTFMGISFPHPYFGIILIRLDDASGFRRGDTESEWALIRFVAGKISEEMTSLPSYSVEMDKHTIAVITNLPLEHSRQEYYEWAERLNSILEERFRTLTTLAVSEVHTGAHSIPTGLKECTKALDYSIFANHKSVLLYEEVKNTKGVYYNFPLETEVKLINATKSGDAAKAIEVIRNLYTSNFEGNQLTPELGKLLFSNLISTLFKLLNTLSLQYEDIFGQTRSPMSKLWEVGSIEELYQDVVAMYEQVCMHVNTHRGDPAILMLERMKTYINEQYANPMLSLAYMAEQFQITPQYLSTFFKKNAGVTLTDYLAQVRLKHAKALLRNDDHTIAAIAMKVGYSSDIGFTRMFKKYEGITPGRYKEMHKS
ncbi:AraC family transcriptional regulator [Paenibacillus sp. PAMC21692]|uniref:AraC family transcriptional regulator n=1 Tax=Paenibacillus sp. PAMC21692 TaxID=2762320 RepID=UPI00164ED321|nr:AraC family transcriptional regulator [Paenibacillus sp. PAMC21692]QNK58638.1 AraC family transcriptional regulator [Paenibacillus sp. PAMC21692]